MAGDAAFMSSSDCSVGQNDCFLALIASRVDSAAKSSCPTWAMVQMFSIADLCKQDRCQSKRATLDANEMLCCVHVMVRMSCCSVGGLPRHRHACMAGYSFEMQAARSLCLVSPIDEHISE